MARIVTVGTPANESERQMIALFRDKLPETCTVYSNLEFVNFHGQPYEYDHIVMGERCVLAIETKDYHGTIHGNAGQWILGPGSTIKSPIPLLNKKTKVLADRLRRYSPLLGNVYVHSIILIVDPRTKIHLDDPQSDRVVNSEKVIEYILSYGRDSRKELSPVERTSIDKAIYEHFRPVKKDRKMGDYSLLDTVNKNPSYATYLARHELIPYPERFFLKVYDLDLYASPDERKKQKDQILHEAMVLNSLGEHENVVRAYPPFPWEDDQIVIPYEWIDGRTLRSMLLSSREMSMSVKQDLALQLARGLRFLHERKVVHRDIRPENIMVRENGAVKIVNFDCSKWERGDMPTIATFAGKHIDERYTAPEVWKNAGGASSRSDIYSLGITLFEIMTGAPPFAHLIDLVRCNQMPGLPNEEHVPWIHDLGEMIKSMCEVSLEKRLGSVQGLINLLEVTRGEITT